MQEPANEPGLIGLLYIWGAAFVSWATGEAGKVIIAGAAGGLLRWLIYERKTIRNGLLQIGSGALCAHYLQAFVLALLSIPFGQIADKGMAGFIAGLGGISLAKIIIAAVEARSRNVGEPGDGAA